MKVVYAANERLVILVNDLLNISRIESGRQKYEFKYNDIVAMVDEMMEKLKLQAEVKKLPLVFEKPKKGFPKVLCDQERILDVIMNFIDNAIKYTEKGKVSVFLKPEPDGMITFSVKDTGMPHTNFRWALYFFLGNASWQTLLVFLVLRINW